jgi:hypothetical protein
MILRTGAAKRLVLDAGHVVRHPVNQRSSSALRAVSRTIPPSTKLKRAAQFWHWRNTNRYSGQQKFQSPVALISAVKGKAVMGFTDFLFGGEFSHSLNRISSSDGTQSIHPFHCLR